VIRDALAEDLPAIVDIYNATIPARESTADLEPVTISQRGAWFIAHSPERRPLWVLDEDGEIVAWLSFRDFYGRPAYAATAEVGVYVRADRRRLGLGARLLQEAIRRGPSLGLSTLLALIFAHNSASVALFTEVGFVPWGRLPRVARLDTRLADLLILGRVLGSPVRPARGAAGAATRAPRACRPR
jgi:L-amino acid N-acyltransferase YncA